MHRDNSVIVNWGSSCSTRRVSKATALNKSMRRYRVGLSSRLAKVPPVVSCLEYDEGNNNNNNKFVLPAR